jgi:hypothetical protein
MVVSILSIISILKECERFPLFLDVINDPSYPFRHVIVKFISNAVIAIVLSIVAAPISIIVSLTSAIVACWQPTVLRTSFAQVIMLRFFFLHILFDLKIKLLI